jgi:hypothetical protein
VKIVKRIRRYKYLPFDEGSLCVISEGTIKFTQPSKLNDPFDCSPDFDVSSIEDYLKTRPDLLRRAGEALNLSSAELVKEEPAMIKRVETAAEEGAFSKPAVEQVGICSLTRDPLNLLMWAHYACGHTGFVVEFDIPLVVTDVDSPPTKDRILEWLTPQVVEYQVTRPVANFFDDKDTMGKKQFLIKEKCWTYEQEERVIDYIRGHGIHKYDRPTILSSIIAGMNIGPKEYMALVKSVEKVNHELNLTIGIYRAEPVKGKGRFGLFVPTRDDLKPMKIT